MVDSSVSVCRLSGLYNQPDRYYNPGLQYAVASAEIYDAHGTLTRLYTEARSQRTDYPARIDARSRALKSAHALVRAWAYDNNLRDVRPTTCGGELAQDTNSRAYISYYVDVHLVCGPFPEEPSSDL